MQYIQQQESEVEEGNDWRESMSDLERERLVKDVIFKIRGLSKADPSTKVGKAITLLDTAREEGVSELSIYNAVIKQLLSTGRGSPLAPKHMAAILQRMRDDSLAPDIKTYNQILDFFAQVHDCKQAQEMYEEMMSKGVAPDQRTLSHMIMAHSRGSPNAMYRAVEELNSKNWQASRGAYLGMIAVMARHQDWPGVIDTIRRMRAESKKPTEAAFVAAFRAAHYLAEPDTCKDLFEHRMETGLPPQEHVYVKMMVVLLAHGRVDECLEYWRQLVCVKGINGVQISPETYNFAIKCTASTFDLDEMEVVVGMMQEQGVTPTDDTYLAALYGLTGRGEHVGGGAQLDLVARAFDSIEGAGAPPSTSVQHRVAVSYAFGEKWQKSIDMFEAVLARKSQISPRGWRCLIMSQFNLQKYSDIKEAWARSTSPEKRKIVHPYTSFEYAMKAACHLEDADWALQLRKMASDSGHGSIHLDNLVVKVLARAGRLEKARDILQTWETHALRGVSSRVFQEAYDMLLVACRDIGNAEMALLFLEGMRKGEPPYRPSPSSLAYVLEVLKENGRAGEVATVFEQLCPEKTDARQPEAELYVFIAEACFEAGDRAGTVKYCEEAKKHGLAASEAALAFAEEAIGEAETEDGDVEGVAEPVLGPSSAEGGETGAGSSPTSSACVGGNETVLAGLER